MEEELPQVRIDSWGGLAPVFVSGLPLEKPLIIGNWSELGGSTFLAASDALLRPLVIRGDMNAIPHGRPPGDVDSASWSSALRSWSRLIPLSAECNALTTGLVCRPSDVDAPSLWSGVWRRRGVGSRGDANTSL